MAASIAYRCEIDLSPGRRTEPVIRLAGLIFLVLAEVKKPMRSGVNYS